MNTRTENEAHQLDGAIIIIANQLPDVPAQVLLMTLPAMRESLMRGWVKSERVKIEKHDIKIMDRQALIDSLMTWMMVFPPEKFEAAVNEVYSSLPEGTWRFLWNDIKDKRSADFIPQWVAEGIITRAEDGVKVDGKGVRAHLFSMFPKDPEKFYGDQWRGWPGEQEEMREQVVKIVEGRRKRLIEEALKTGDDSLLLRAAALRYRILDGYDTGMLSLADIVAFGIHGENPKKKTAPRFFKGGEKSFKKLDPKTKVFTEVMVCAIELFNTYLRHGMVIGDNHEFVEDMLSELLTADEAAKQATPEQRLMNLAERAKKHGVPEEDLEAIIAKYRQNEISARVSMDAVHRAITLHEGRIEYLVDESGKVLGEA
jgi:hypothetical protein